MICDNIRNSEFRNELVKYIRKIANEHREMLIAAEVLERMEDKTEALRQSKQYHVGMDLSARAGRVSWFQREADILWLQTTTSGEYAMGLSVQDVETVLNTAKIGIAGALLLVVSGTSSLVTKMEVTSEFSGELTAMDAESNFGMLRSIPEGAMQGIKNSAGKNNGEMDEKDFVDEEGYRRQEIKEGCMSTKKVEGAIITPAKEKIGKLGSTNRQRTIDGFLVTKPINKGSQQQTITSMQNKIGKNREIITKTKVSARKGGGEKLRNKYMVLADSSSEEGEEATRAEVDNEEGDEEDDEAEEGELRDGKNTMDMYEDEKFKEEEEREDEEQVEDDDMGVKKKIKINMWAQESSSEEGSNPGEEQKNTSNVTGDSYDAEQEEADANQGTEYPTNDMVQTNRYDFRIVTDDATYVFRPTTYFMQILYSLMEGKLAVEEAVALAEFRMGILRIEGQESATPQHGWGGYVALLQARWMNDKRDKEDTSISADLRSKKFREELSNHLIKISQGDENMLEVVDKLVSGQEDLEERLEFQGDAKLRKRKAGDISWYKKEDDILWLIKATIGHVLPRVTVSEAETLLETAKIGIVGRKQFIIAGPCKVKEGLTELMSDYLRNKVEELQSEKQEKSREEKVTMLRRQIELRSEESEKEVTRMLIYNIPNQMKRVKDLWQADMTRALETVPHIKVTQKELWTAMQTYFDTIDGDSTFGIITKCAQITVGTGFTSTHFVMLGDNREFLEGERPKHFEYKVRTKYMIHILTEEEAKALPNALVQCYFRGCCEEYEINNFLRIVISRYLRDRQLQRLAMVQMKRHRVAATQFLNETVIVVYALGKDAERQISEGNSQLGLVGNVYMKQMEYCYLKFEMVVAHVGIHGYVPDYVYDDKHVVVLVGIHITLSYKEIIDLFEKIIDFRKVIYWIFRKVYLSRPRSIIIGIKSESLPRIPDDENLRKLLDVNKKWRSDATHLLFREFRELRKATMMSDPVSGTTSIATTKEQPKFNLPKTYASAVVTTSSSELTSSTSQEVITTFRQQLVLYDQRIQQQEQRLIQSEQRNEQLTSQMTELVKKYDSVQQQLQDMTRESVETKTQIQNISSHIIGQDQRVVQLLMEALEGRVPVRREHNND